MKHNLLKSVIISAILLMGVSSAWAYTATFRCVPALTFGNNWKNGNSCKVKLKLGDDKEDATYDMHATGLMYEKSGNLYEIYEGTASDLPYDGAKNLHFERWEGSTWKENQGQYDDWRNCTAWSGSMYYGEWGNYSYKSWNLPSDKYIYFEKPSEWTYAQFMVGHYSSSEGYVMTPLLNTKLYYVKTTQWDGYLQSAFIDANNKWGSESNSVGSRKLHAEHSSDVFHYQELINTSNGYGLFTTNFKDDHSTVLSFSRENSYSILNKSQTITLQSYNLVSKTYTNSSTVGSVSFSSIKMSSATSTTNSSQTITNSASADAIYTANVTLTASVNPGYKFDCWSDGNNQLGTNLTYSYSVPSTNKTVYARFSEITYSVQVKSADNNQGTVSPTPVNAGQFTGVAITATPKIGYSFVNWTATTGITIADPNSASTTITATKAGTVTANFKAQPATTIYLEPTGHWNSDNPQYVAHVWIKNNTSVNEDIIMAGVGEAPYKYYKAEVPYGYTGVVFFRKKSDGSTIWNQTADLTIPTDNKTLYEITSTGTGTSTPATGEWKAANLVYTITLGYCEFGTYSIKYNGQSYFSKQPNENVTLDVPAGAQIEILEGQPHSNAYKGDVIKAKPTRTTLSSGQKLTVNGDITLDDNFVTKEPHVVYLGVPNSVNTWNSTEIQNNTRKFYVWRTETGHQYNIDATNDAGKYVFEINGIKYYQFTIAAGCNDFRFEQKDATPDNDTYSKTVWFPFQIPLTDVNCFTLDGNYTTSNGHNYYTGSWNVLPAKQRDEAKPGDHRLLYIEQKVEEENGHPNTIVTKAHPSDIIRQGDTRTIYSLHIYNEVENGENGMNDPEILLQECTGYDGVDPIWTTRERHMVFGPLHADFGMAAMPGRRNADGDPDAVLRYDNGIENIKNDLKNIQAYNSGDPTTHFHISKDDPTAEDYQTYINNFQNDECSGVWNFIVTREDNNFTGLDLTQTARYEGDYYVRTDCADGGWDRYTVNGNHMTRSDISKRNSNYSHYYCKWIDQVGTNVTYTIANDYGYAISDTLEADKTDLWGKELATKMVDDDQLLPAKANVRFSWNEKSNFLHRAYIAGSTNVADRFLVLGGKTGQIYNAAGQSLTEGANNSDRYGLKDNEEIFSDIENWVYQTDVQMIPGAELQVTADYNEQVQYFVGKEGIFNNTILQGSGTEKYLVRLLYDFKTNELISAYVPGASTHVDKISTNLMIIRQNYNEAKQLVFNNGDMSSRENRKAYGVIEFTEDYLTNPSIKYLKRCLYWVSFPFNVNLSEAFGSLVYGKHWLIQEYDGARRAAEGLWKESESFWNLHWEPNNITLQAGLGYVIEIDINQMIKDNIIDPTDDKQQIATLYFPSSTPITREIINQNSYTVNIPDHLCTIVRTGTYGDRTIRDSHWNVIGVPSYVNTGATFSDQTFALNNVVKYYYRWDGEVDKYTAMEANEQAYDFQSMYAYMVQYAGDITWNSVLLDVEPAQIAAKKNANSKEHAMRLELQQGNSILDKTFIRLQEDDVTTAFDFNYDLCKIKNKGANIYSLIATDRDPIEVAGNVMPVANTTIPVGVVIAAAGEYTFAMPEGTDGIVVELIDYEANTTTNLLFNDYTVSLPKGTFDNRFALSVKPDKTATSVENIFDNAKGDETSVRKFIIDGVLYMQKDGVLYDAQGHIVR